MTQDKNQRKITNIVVDPRAQLRLLLPFFVLFVTSMAIIVSILFKLLGAVEGLSVSNANQELIAIKFHELTSSILAISLTGMCFISILTILFWIFYSHRIFGPAVPILRQIEKLKNREYDHRIHLRKYDEFKPVAESLNSLAERLQAENAKASRKNEDV